MRTFLFSCLALLCTTLPASLSASSGASHSDPPDQDSLRMLVRELIETHGVDISGQFFIAYEAGDDHGDPFSNFFINRGYINFRKELLPGISGRLTPDISVDREGDGEGDLEMRLKYCYVRADLPSLSIFSEPVVEFGLISRPWFGFEQKINRYRVQGNMFLDQNGIINTTDFGASAMALIGGEMPEQYQRQVNSNWPGKYGSIAIGVFNGGGYHAIEANINKTLEGRVTLRPLPDLIPGLQFTYSGVVGKGNREMLIDWNMNIGFISFEHRNVVFTGTYFSGTGDFRGAAVDPMNNPIDQEGFSLFTELRIHTLPLSIIGRFDRMRDLPEFGRNKRTDRIIAGVAYHFARSSKLLIDYERAEDEHGTLMLDAAKFSVQFDF